MQRGRRAHRSQLRHLSRGSKQEGAAGPCGGAGRGAQGARCEGRQSTGCTHVVQERDWMNSCLHDAVPAHRALSQNKTVFLLLANPAPCVLRALRPCVFVFFMSPSHYDKQVKDLTAKLEAAAANQSSLTHQLQEAKAALTNQLQEEKAAAAEATQRAAAVERQLKEREERLREVAGELATVMRRADRWGHARVYVFECVLGGWVRGWVMGGCWVMGGGSALI